MKLRTYTRKIKKKKYYSAITRWAASLFTYMQRERETWIERGSYTRTISYNLAEQWEKYSDKNTDKDG